MTHRLTILVLVATGFCAAQPTASTPKDYEAETHQYGGRGWDRYVFVGEIRCPGVTQAIVGARIAQGQGGGVTGLQALCASVQCKDHKCTTGRPVPVSAQRAPSQSGRDQACPANQVVSGVKATESRDFVSSIELECSPIIDMIGLKDYQPMPVLFELPIARRNPRDQCVDYGATALSFAVNRNGYVRAFSLFCGRVADPRIAFYAGFTRGYSRCMEENVTAEILLSPISFLQGRIRYLRQALMFIGKSEVIYSLLTESPDRSSPRAAGEQAGYRFCQALELGREFKFGGIKGSTPTPKKWEPSPLPENQFYKPHVRGNLGERIAAEALAAAGYKIVYFKPDISGTTQPGFDIVALKDGKLWIFDNKAFARTSEVTLRSVSALDENFDVNLNQLRRDLGIWIQSSPPQAQKVLLEARQILANMTPKQLVDGGHVKKVVTNASVILEPGRHGVKTIHQDLVKKKIEFLDITSLASMCMPPDFHGVITPPCDLDFRTSEGALVPVVK